MGIFKPDTIITPQIDILTNSPIINNWSPINGLLQAVNFIDGGAKEAARALRKKLRAGDSQQQLNSITVMQALVDGCGSKFKAELATIKFGLVIQQVMESKSTDNRVKGRLMERLSAWATTFSSDPSLEIIPQLYHKLSMDGVMRGVPTVEVLSLPQSPVSAPFMRPVAPSGEQTRQKKMQILQDIELANNNAHMLVEAVSFADPELEAVEENALIREFHSKCLTLQRGVQIYLSEETNEATADEKCLAALLACNQELVLAIGAYNSMMEQQAVSRAMKMQQSSHPTQHGYSHGNIATADGAGVGSGYKVSYSEYQSGKSKSAHEETPAADPFADDGLYVASSADMPSVKDGKRPDRKDEAEEQELIQLLKDHAFTDPSHDEPSSYSASGAKGSASTASVVSPVV
ncbi:putative actin patch assembly and actin polymerization protein [Mortierella alpina]|nr:putative actin patch assembly and actin polymerization protein [Mortierella alpina]